MADEGLLNVEDDIPILEAQPPAAVVAAPAEPPPPEPPPDPDEVDAVDINGTKLVPLAALRNVRSEVKALKERAAHADTLGAQLAQLQGQVAGYQQVQDQLRRQHAPPPAAPPQQDPRALAFAQKLDLYTTDASGAAVPDVAKAASILGIVQEVAGQMADARVLPMAQQTARDRSIANYNWALTVKDPQGNQIPRELINQIWQSMPMEASANPEIAKTLVFAAAGMDRFAQKAAPAPPPGPPVVTEGVGGNPRTRPVLSALETRVAAERGMDEKKWADSTKDFVKGRTVTLED